MADELKKLSNSPFAIGFIWPLVVLAGSTLGSVYITTEMQAERLAKMETQIDRTLKVVEGLVVKFEGHVSAAEERHGHTSELIHQLQSRIDNHLTGHPDKVHSFDARLKVLEHVVFNSEKVPVE